MPLLVESDIAENATRHEEDEGRIQENQSSLSNVRIVEENQSGGQYTCREGVPRFPHDQIHHDDGQRTEERRQRPESQIGDVILDIGFANIVEEEVSIVSD